jgi:hypothetical protein
VAALCADGYLAGNSAAETYAWLSRSSWRPTGEGVLRALVEARRLATRPDSPGGVDDWIRALLSAYAREGAAFEDESRTHVVRHTLREIEFHLALLMSAFSDGDRADRRLLNEYAEQLKEISRRIKDLSGEGRPRRWHR